MNLILFEPEEIDRPLPLADPRVRHILEVLRQGPGQAFDAGVVDGARGRGVIEAVTQDFLQWGFAPGGPLPPQPDVILLIGLPRPQSARDVLRDATTLGATALDFVISERTDVNYASSTLWSGGEWRRCIRAGAAQAGDPRLPRVSWGTPLSDALAGLPAGCPRYALDNYEAEGAFRPGRSGFGPSAVLALGPERGWSTGDRDLLRRHGFQLLHLGPRILRIETAVVAALTLLSPPR